MAYKCELDPTLGRVNLDGVVTKLLDEIAALSSDYVKFCLNRGEIKLCGYLHAVVDLEECRVSFLGLSVSVPLSASVNDEILSLLKYAKLIIGGGGLATFYIDKKYSIGVYHLLTRGSKSDWGELVPAEFSEVSVFVEE